MFELWRRFDAKEAISLMNRHHKALLREHASLLRLLRSNGNDFACADVGEQVSILRQAWRAAIIDHSEVCRALVDRFHVVKLANFANALLAQERLSVTCDKIRQTLQRADGGAEMNRNPAT